MYVFSVFGKHIFVDLFTIWELETSRYDKNIQKPMSCMSTTGILFCNYIQVCLEVYVDLRNCTSNLHRFMQFHVDLCNCTSNLQWFM